jgi:hypothetical protein
VSNFWSPPRRAPGFPAGCADAGDVLAGMVGQSVTILVVTTALRSAIEGLGDPALGLAQVRAALGAVGSRFSAPWRVGYYGKDLVAVLPGVQRDRVVATARTVAAVGQWPSPHGWAWIPAHASTLSVLLESCYRASVAARIRRDHPDLSESEAVSVLDQWRADSQLAPEPRQVASMLAAVLVRPYGTADCPAARLSEDPRWPGVQSADNLLPALARRGRQNSAAALYVITDVHDIEWGLAGDPSGSEARVACEQSDGNAPRLLPLARAWLGRGISTDATLAAAYRDRLAREQMLAAHLRELASQCCELFGTLGDGLEGFVQSREELVEAIAKANVRPWQLRSGVGAACIYDNLCEAGSRKDHADCPLSRPNASKGALPDADARARALFSLHVTKALKYIGTQHATLHVFGTPLGSEEEAALLFFLRGLRARGREGVGYHHLRHARAYAEFWRQHLSSKCYAEFEHVIASY